MEDYERGKDNGVKCNAKVKLLKCSPNIVREETDDLEDSEASDSSKEKKEEKKEKKEEKKEDKKEDKLERSRGKHKKEVKKDDKKEKEEKKDDKKDDRKNDKKDDKNDKKEDKKEESKSESIPDRAASKKLKLDLKQAKSPEGKRSVRSKDTEVKGSPHFGKRSPSSQLLPTSLQESNGPSSPKSLTTSTTSVSSTTTTSAAATVTLTTSTPAPEDTMKEEEVTPPPRVPVDSTLRLITASFHVQMNAEGSLHAIGDEDLAGQEFKSLAELIRAHPRLRFNYTPDGFPETAISDFAESFTPSEDIWGPQIPDTGKIP